jgi:hypothetical protein
VESTLGTVLGLVAALFLLTLAILAIAYSIVDIVRSHRPRRASAAWIIVMVTIPLFGALAYAFAAVRRVDRDRRAADGPVDAPAVVPASLSNAPSQAPADELVKRIPSAQDGRVSPAQFDGLTRQLVRL